MNINTYSTDLELSSSQYWSITDGAQTGLGLTGDFTFEAWVKLESLAATAELLGKFAGTGNVKAYLISILSTGAIFMQYFNASGRTHDITTGTPITTGSWIHIAISCDVSAQDFNCYINSVSEALTAGDRNANSIHTNDAFFGIGGRDNQGSPENYLDGLVDDVRVWDVVRTQEEIKRNMHLQLNGNEPNLQGYWKFNNDGNDNSPNGNDLTNNNSCTFSATDKAPIRRIF